MPIELRGLNQQGLKRYARITDDGQLHVCDPGTSWLDTRLAYNGDGDLEYRGRHLVHDAAEDDEDWYIWKLTWSSGNLTRMEGPLTGAWEDRAILGWGT